ncbi:MAG: phosphatase PAP2 family protein [Clostridia bacterium]|nr:phosphatase PAP2 family protein [Clostridia bacterium]
MESMFAQWLNETFSAFDGAILGFYHRLAESCGTLLTPLMRAVSFTGDKGLVLLILSFLLCFFAKTRKTGFCMLLSIGFGALMTNLILKEAICRIRPYEANELFREFWTFVGAHRESDLSFPSGHTTAAAAAATGLWLTRGKKYLSVSIPYVFLMAASRNYFIVHYPTDVIAGALVGTLGGILAYILTRWIFRLLHPYAHKKAIAFILYSDLKTAVSHPRKKNQKKENTP